MSLIIDLSSLNKGGGCILKTNYRRTNVRLLALALRARARAHTHRHTDPYTFVNRQPSADNICKMSRFSVTLIWEFIVSVVPVTVAKRANSRPI